MSRDVSLCLIAHTNVGKTTLARTLLRREMGEVVDQAHVTLDSSVHTLVETRVGGDDARLRLWDTPGFGDSARLVARLRGGPDPIGRFCREPLDPVAQKAMWCSQQAVLAARDHADVVLYLVNDAEGVDSAGFVSPELDLLSWIGKPVVLCLNQIGRPAGEAQSAVLEQAWRGRTAAWPVVKAVTSLDAFWRCWVEEGRLFEIVGDVLPVEKRATMEALEAAWEKRNFGVFEDSMGLISAYLVRAASDREVVAEKFLRKQTKRAVAALNTRLTDAGSRLMSALVPLHGLAGTSVKRVATSIENVERRGRPPLDPTKTGAWGAVGGGLLLGIKADLATGGLSFGGGAALGAILGALFGTALAKSVAIVKSDGKPAVAWNHEFLDGLTKSAMLQYVAVAHFGRGRGEYVDVAPPDRWVASIKDAVAPVAGKLDSAWSRAAGRRPEGVAAATRDLDALVRGIAARILTAQYPSSPKTILSRFEQMKAVTTSGDDAPATPDDRAASLSRSMGRWSREAIERAKRLPRLVKEFGEGLREGRPPKPSPPPGEKGGKAGPADPGGPPP